MTGLNYDVLIIGSGSAGASPRCGPRPPVGAASQMG